MLAVPAPMVATLNCNTPELKVHFSQALMYALMSMDKDDVDKFLAMKCAEDDTLGEDVRNVLLSRERHRAITRHLRPFNPAVVHGVSGRSFRDTTDLTPHASRWVRTALRVGAEILLTQHSSVTLDDWLSGLRALDIQVKHKSDKKAATWYVALCLYVCCARCRDSCASVCVLTCP